MLSFGFLAAAVYFYLPSYFANMTPPVIAKLNWLAPFDRPVNEELFGANKTWRGLISGTVSGFSIYLLQIWLYQFDFTRSFSIIDYFSTNWVLGIFMPFGALAGDITFSFFKRRFNILPGAPWIPFDQIDHVVGSWLVSSLVISLSAKFWVTVAIITFFLHMLVNWIGYSLGINKTRL